MFNILFFYFIIFPISEYLVHFILHKTNNWIHKKHHIKYHSKSYSIEKTPIIIASTLYYYHYIHSANCFLIYWIIHTIIHIKPSLVPILYKHHHIHHTYNNCNYAVSTIWPDYLFGTIKH